MKIKIWFVMLLMLGAAACNFTGQHLIHDKAYRQQVHEKFELQKTLAAGRDSALFGVFNLNLSIAEKEGLEFLFAYMPLSDLAAKDGNYYLRQVRTSLEARNEFSWGAKVPEQEFLHFVLPYRVNNEYTDTARQAFYAELKDRLKGMDMATAALEVNHWCHEKVIYKSTDERTSGPLTTVRTAFGRCGEESTFTVAALRSVGIPARQVYTPRWAHTDDNHAWVEVWIDGKWHFMGACEPEPALDMAWFAEPVKRAMMTHTFVFGRYAGNEEVLENNEQYARLNLLSNYTKTRKLTVMVVDPHRKPAANVRVEYQLYNYAEFYPIATLYTDSAGTCTATTGLGDMLIWAVRDGQFDYSFAQGNNVDTIRVQLHALNPQPESSIVTLVPPAPQPVETANAQKAEENNRRLQAEDSIRNAYTATFPDSLSAAELASRLQLDPAKVWHFISLSRGNYAEIQKYFEKMGAFGSVIGLQLLDGISEKDLHDVSASTLLDHLMSYKTQPRSAGLPPDIVSGNLLAPRIGRELLTPWRSFISRYFAAAQVAEFRKSPVEVARWISENIIIDSVSNYYNVPLSPEGSLQLKRTDVYSRNLLFVAICRTFGIPARLEPATRSPQFYNSDWHRVFTGHQLSAPSVKGSIVLENNAADPAFVPQYYIHYTLARFEKGKFVTLDYETDASLHHFPCELTVDTGYYRLITGNRLTDGEVLCNISYFNLGAGQRYTAVIKLAEATAQSGVLGKADMQATFITEAGKQMARLADYQSKNGLVVAIIEPGREPTKHLIEDIEAASKALDKWGGKMLFVIARDKRLSGLTSDQYGKMPALPVFGYDADGQLAASVQTVCSISGQPRWPVIVLINQAGEIVWHSEGYSIGLGDQLVKQITGNGLMP